MANVQLTPLLEKQRIFRSCNPDEAVAFLHGKKFRFDLSRRAAKQLDLQINGIYLPNLYVGYIQYGSPATIQTNPERDDYWLQLPIREHIEFTVAHQCISCGPLPRRRFIAHKWAPDTDERARGSVQHLAHRLSADPAAGRALGHSTHQAARVCLIDEPERRLRSQPGPMRVSGRDGLRTGGQDAVGCNHDQPIRAVHHVQVASRPSK